MPAWHSGVDTVTCNRAGTAGNGVAVSSKAGKGRQQDQVPNGKSASPSHQDGSSAPRNSVGGTGDASADPDTDAGNQQSDYTDGDDAGNNDSDSDYSEEEDDDEDYRGGSRRGAARNMGKQQQQRPQRGSAQVASDTEGSRKRPNWKEPRARPENARVASLRSSRPPPPPKPPKPSGGGGGGGGGGSGGKRSGSKGTASRQGSGALGAGGDSEAGEAAGAGGRSRAGSRGPGGSSAAGSGGEEASDYSEGSGSDSGSGSGSESEGDADNPATLERVMGEETAKAAVEEVAGMWEVSRLAEAVA